MIKDISFICVLPWLTSRYCANQVLESICSYKSAATCNDLWMNPKAEPGLKRSAAHFHAAREQMAEC